MKLKYDLPAMVKSKKKALKAIVDKERNLTSKRSKKDERVV